MGLVMRALPALAMLAFVCSCGNNDSIVAPDYLVVRTSDTVYTLGDTVFVTATNVGSTAVAIDFCQGQMERLAGGHWQAAPPNPDVMPPCLSRKTAVGPGEVVTTWNVVHAGLTSGIYRLRFDEPRFVSNAYRIE